jgi:hypothetical protein
VPSVSSTVTISGRVRTASGSALANAGVSGIDFDGSGNNLGSTTAGPTGAYSLSGPPARYDLLADLSGFTQSTPLPGVDATGEASNFSQDILLAANNASVSGTLTATGGGTNTSVALMLGSSFDNPTRGVTYSVAEGSVAPSGAYTLQAVAQQYAALQGFDFGGQYVFRTHSLTGSQPYSLSGSAVASLVLPTLSFSETGCSTATCSLTVSGAGWLAGDSIQVMLHPQSGSYITVGTAIADSSGTLPNTLLSFSATANGVFHVHAADSTSTKYLETTATYAVSGVTGQPDIKLLSQPQRLADTRTAGGPISAGASRCFVAAGVAGIPIDAGAVVLNATAVGQTSNGWLSVYPAGQAVPGTSTLNFGTSQYAIANGTIMGIGSGGQVCVNVGTINSVPGSAQVILDVTGYLPSSALGDVAMLPAPARLSDTRTSGGPVASGTSRCFQVTGVAGIPADASAVILNVTAVGYSTGGWLTAYPNGRPVPATSTVNFDQSEYAMANNSIMPIGNGGQVCVNVSTINSAPGSAHIILDAEGYLTASALSRLPMLSAPQRLVDTRTDGGPVASGGSRCFTLAGLAGIPAAASGVILNLTAVGYARQGWLTAYPAGQPVPATSTVNFDPSEYAMANGGIVALANAGQLCVSVGTINSAPGSAQVIVDVVGYLP